MALVAILVGHAPLQIIVANVRSEGQVDVVMRVLVHQVFTVNQMGIVAICARETSCLTEVVTMDNVELAIRAKLGIFVVENYIGCGDGRYPNLFVEWGAKSVIGIDDNEEMIKNCLDKYQDNPSLKFSKSPYQDLDFQNEFDVITSIHSLYYDYNVESLNQTFFKISKALKPGGLFFAFLVNGSVIANLSEEEERNTWKFSRKPPHDGDMIVAEFYDKLGTQQNLLGTIHAVFWHLETYEKFLKENGFDKIQFHSPMPNSEILKEDREFWNREFEPLSRQILLQARKK
uniref:Methyltransferase domain-containing protein n=1 Tax=Acrobeloides nanus TaxID=290746 RepID=A0A914CV58_9BILA